MRRIGGTAAAFLSAAAVGLASAPPAQAAWRTLASAYGGKVQYLACKTAETGGYGPVWRITLVFATSPGYQGAAEFRVWRNGQPVQYVPLVAGNGAWDVKVTYASRYYDDYWGANWGASPYGQNGVGGVVPRAGSFSRIAYC
jgi:hypothetical protein